MIIHSFDLKFKACNKHFFNVAIITGSNGCEIGMTIDIKRDKYRK